MTLTTACCNAICCTYLEPIQRSTAGDKVSVSGQNQVCTNDHLRLPIACAGRGCIKLSWDHERGKGHELDSLFLFRQLSKAMFLRNAATFPWKKRSCLPWIVLVTISGRAWSRVAANRAFSRAVAGAVPLLGFCLSGSTIFSWSTRAPWQSYDKLKSGSVSYTHLTLPTKRIV